MPSYYYSKEIEIGPNGEKIGFMFIDTCYLLCSNFKYSKIDG
jgi:hypothetical protein